MNGGSTVPGAPLFQKPLSWVQRFFYQMAGGALPPANISLSIDQDWPLETPLLTPADYVTIAGSVVTTLYAPPADRHGIVYLATTSVVAVATPATDVVGLLLRAPTGDGARVYEATVAVPVGQAYIMLGGNKIGHGLAISSVYVGPLQELRIVHDSVAGGSTMRPRAYVVDRPAYYPLRLP